MFGRTCPVSFHFLFFFGGCEADAGKEIRFVYSYFSSGFTSIATWFPLGLTFEAATKYAGWLVWQRSDAGRSLCRDVGTRAVIGRGSRGEAVRSSRHRGKRGESRGVGRGACRATSVPARRRGRACRWGCMGGSDGAISGKRQPRRTGKCLPACLPSRRSIAASHAVPSADNRCACVRGPRSTL